jgi:hypothetical protein
MDKSTTVDPVKERRSLPERLAVHQQARSSVKLGTAKVNQRSGLDRDNTTKIPERILLMAHYIIEARPWSESTQIVPQTERRTGDAFLKLNP